ncbi:malate dehydrogenase [Sporothrix schenckii 1099-18]|uniref:Malate dehydrogenase n=2 Tax=Sporothrix schenckii TaxID=29908 RepID=U7PZX5_SPOS1|nr:malate dehydrogenase [Sporothrix schenckii 1099-18]ERT00462.1 hypothetical protein HMPREF1624_03835 [Sporothrix schenckii ATCC 58251]KJR85048.1 malate dehydrogenase [Sporothrix schenckii 1099-18]
MAARSLTLLASLLAVVSAAPPPPCKAPTYALPLTGTGTELPPVSPGLALLKIAVGHGIQNYTCASNSAATVATGALATLYDVTNLYPGTAKTGLHPDAFNAISNAVLWGQNLPLNLQNAAAASPGTPSIPNVLGEADYGAVIADPFLAAAALPLPGVLPKSVPFLGHHYFDSNGVPIFNLVAANLYGSMNKTGNVKAPSTAGTGILSTGAVDWLQLSASSNAASNSIKQVYRVITVGGASHTCDILNAAGGSVPYTAFYWFFG